MQAKRRWEICWIVVLVITSLQFAGLGQNHVSVDFMTSYIYETRQVESIASDQELIGYTEAETELYNSKDLTGDVVHSPTLVYSSSKPISWVSYMEYLTPPYRWEFPDLEEGRSYWGVKARYNPPHGDVRFNLGCDVDYAVNKVEFKAPGGKQTVKLTLEPKDWNLMIMGKLELWVGVGETDEVVPRIISIEARRGDTWLDPMGTVALWNSGKGPGGKYEVEVIIGVEVKEGHELVRYLPTVDVQVKFLQGRGKEGLKKGLARAAKTGIGRWEWEAGKPCIWEWEEWVRKVVRYGGMSAPYFRPPTNNAVEATIEKGLAWLAERQNDTGSWSYYNPDWGWDRSAPSVGVTALATMALLLHGYSEDHPTVAKAIQYILSCQTSNGYFCSEEHGSLTYETSLAILALAATGNPQYADEIAKARDWLVESQHNEEEPYRYGLSCNNPEECWAYGGWGYSYKDTRDQDEFIPDLVPYLWADLSNTQFALMALKAAGLPPDSKVWKRAEDFVSRCQNLDGGFNYMPPWEGRNRRAWEAGGSYGSMTAAGIWCLRLCGVPVEDARIQKGLEWLRRFYSYWDNPFLEETFHYYYLWTVTRAFLYSGLPGILEPAPPLEGWYWDFAGYLVEMQQEDGSWISRDKEREPPELATCFALLTLEKATLPKPFGP